MSVYDGLPLRWAELGRPDSNVVRKVVNLLPEDIKTFLSPGKKAVLHYLLWLAWQTALNRGQKKGAVWCDPRCQHIADKTGLRRDTVRAYTRHLRDMGLIAIRHTHFKGKQPPLPNGRFILGNNRFYPTPLLLRGFYALLATGQLGRGGCKKRKPHDLLAERWEQYCREAGLERSAEYALDLTGSEEEEA